jgi:hypothetical protein
MNYSKEQLLDYVAPCSLLCYSCPAFTRGIVCDLSGKLVNYFEGFYKFLAEHLPENLKSKAEEVKSFEERLQECSRPGCNGCRKNRNPDCSVRGCFIPECAKEHGVEYCGEFEAFPLSQGGYSIPQFRCLLPLVKRKHLYSTGWSSPVL